MQHILTSIARRDQEKRAGRRCRTSHRRFAAIAARPTTTPTPDRRTRMPFFSRRPNLHCICASGLCSIIIRITLGLPPNVQDEPRPWLARLVLLGARDVTAMVVGSGALFGLLLISRLLVRGCLRQSLPRRSPERNRRHLCLGPIPPSIFDFERVLNQTNSINAPNQNEIIPAIFILPRLVLAPCSALSPSSHHVNTFATPMPTRYMTLEKSTQTKN
jgi:hypothetical protein